MLFYVDVLCWYSTNARKVLCHVLDLYSNPLFVGLLFSLSVVFSLA